MFLKYITIIMLFHSTLKPIQYIYLIHIISSFLLKKIVIELKTNLLLQK